MSDSFIDIRTHVGNLAAIAFPLSKESKLCQTAALKLGGSISLIETYYNWIDNILPRQIQGRKFPMYDKTNTQHSFVMYEDLKVVSPMVKESSNKGGAQTPLYPLQAEQQLITYSVSLYATQKIYTIPADGSEPTTPQFVSMGVDLGLVPCMLGSRCRNFSKRFLTWRGGV